VLFGHRPGTRQERNNLARLQLAYHNVFASSREGRMVLADILRMFGYWEHDPEFPDLRRAAILLLDRGGWLHSNNIAAIVDGYMNAGQVNGIDGTQQSEDITWRHRTDRTQA